MINIQVESIETVWVQKFLIKNWWNLGVFIGYWLLKNYKKVVLGLKFDRVFICKLWAQTVPISLSYILQKSPTKNHQTVIKSSFCVLLDWANLFISYSDYIIHISLKFMIELKLLKAATFHQSKMILHLFSILGHAPIPGSSWTPFWRQ